ncbi:MAG: YceI family protein [Gammaproteobacteria bacterium]|nr:YceI family protein [Gammaproteobacteria bacterium]
MHKTILTATMAIAIAPLAAHSAPVSYTVDPSHTYPYFEIDHMGYSMMRGRFNSTEGRIVLDREKNTGSVEITIDAESIDTAHKKRDDHLRSPDFLNTGEYPEITFKSTRVEIDGDEATVEGDLTIAGVTRKVTLDVDRLHCAVNPMSKKEHCGFDASTEINRSDFGVSYMVPAVGDEIEIEIALEAVKD